jgi:hypothetical protein
MTVRQGARDCGSFERKRANIAEAAAGVIADSELEKVSANESKRALRYTQVRGRGEGSEQRVRMIDNTLQFLIRTQLMIMLML